MEKTEKRSPEIENGLVWYHSKEKKKLGKTYIGVRQNTLLEIPIVKPRKIVFILARDVTRSPHLCEHTCLLRRPTHHIKKKNTSRLQPIQTYSDAGLVKQFFLYRSTPCTVHLRFRVSVTIPGWDLAPRLY